MKRVERMRRQKEQKRKRLTRALLSLSLLSTLTLGAVTVATADGQNKLEMEKKAAQAHVTPEWKARTLDEVKAETKEEVAKVEDKLTDKTEDKKEESTTVTESTKEEVKSETPKEEVKDETKPEDKVEAPKEETKPEASTETNTSEEETNDTGYYGHDSEGRLLDKNGNLLNDERTYNGSNFINDYVPGQRRPELAGKTLGVSVDTTGNELVFNSVTWDKDGYPLDGKAVRPTETTPTAPEVTPSGANNATSTQPTRMSEIGNGGEFATFDAAC